MKIREWAKRHNDIIVFILFLIVVIIVGQPVWDTQKEALKQCGENCITLW